MTIWIMVIFMTETGLRSQIEKIEEPEDIRECIKMYINWRLQQMNEGYKFYRHRTESATVEESLDTKTIKEMKKELDMFGGLVIRRKTKKNKGNRNEIHISDMNLRPVHIVIEDFEVPNFIIDGVIKVHGGYIIGYYCADCLLAVPVNEMDWLAYDNNNKLTCVTCCGDRIGIIYDTNIVTHSG